ALGERRAVEEELERRIAERPLELAKHAAQRAREIAQLRRARVLEARGVAQREDAGLERKPGGERRERQHMLRLLDDPRPLFGFLVRDVAEQAALPVVVIRPRVMQLVVQALWRNGRGEQLRVRVLERRAVAGRVALEYHDGAEALVTLQVDD